MRATLLVAALVAMLSVGLASLVFATYLFGSVSSPLAGRLAVERGSRLVVPVSLGVYGAGVALTLVDHLVAVVAGVALITIGFFWAWRSRCTGCRRCHSARDARRGAEGRRQYRVMVSTSTFAAIRLSRGSAWRSTFMA